MTVDGEPYDLSEMDDGDKVNHDVLMEAERTGDDYEVTIILRFGANAPESTRFPEPVTITEDGVIETPLYNVDIIIEEEPIIEEGP